MLISKGIIFISPKLKKTNHFSMYGIIQGTLYQKISQIGKEMVTELHCFFVFFFVCFFFSEIFSWNHGFKKSFFTFNSEGYETVVCRFGVYIFHEFIVFNLIFTFLGVLSEILDNIEILKIAKKRNRKKVRTLIISCPIWLIFWCFVPYTDTKNICAVITSDFGLKSGNFWV